MPGNDGAPGIPDVVSADSLGGPVVRSLSADSSVTGGGMSPSAGGGASPEGRVVVIGGTLSDLDGAARPAPPYDCPRNSALVFVKSHANRDAVRELVEATLLERIPSGRITRAVTVTGHTIGRRRLIDRHYAVLARHATEVDVGALKIDKAKFKVRLSPPVGTGILVLFLSIPAPSSNRIMDCPFLSSSDIALHHIFISSFPYVPQTAFKEKWPAVLRKKRACNALQALSRLGCNPAELEAAWRAAESESKTAKLAPGLYVGLLSVNGGKVTYVVNGFYMAMRGKFVGDGKSIRAYLLEWDEEDCSWEDFRTNIVGATDPTKAVAGSLRRTIYERCVICAQNVF